MQVLIRRIDKELPLPEYKTQGAVAMDLSARETVTIAPHAIGIVFLNVSIKAPEGHVILMAARSSLHKRGLTMINGVGVFDEDFCGDEDEYRAILQNYTDEPVIVERGDRIVQIMIIPYVKVTLQEVSSLGNASRGGFGTTGI